jgi:aspartate aminotransferase
MAKAVTLSDRGRLMPASPIRKLVPYADAAKARGVHVYHLNIGQPDIETPPAMIEAYRTLDRKVIEYGPSGGLAAYVEALAGYYGRVGIDVDPAQILVTTGGSEALAFVFQAVAGAGDEIIVPEPFYTNYNGFAVMSGVTLVPVATRAEDGFALPPRERFEERITDRTRAVLFCNPGNPTGAVYTRDEMSMLEALAADRGLFLIADEVYREFVYDGVEHVSVLGLPAIRDRAVLVDSISKQYSACGARVGCIVSRNAELMATVLKFGQARLCPPTVDQIAATAAMSVPDEYFERVRSEYVKRRDLTCDALASIPGVICQKPQGAFYTVAKLPVEDAEQFAVFLLDGFDLAGETVMVAPAAGFYATPGAGRDEVRIAYVLNTADLEKAMRAFAAGLDAFGRTG